MRGFADIKAWQQAQVLTMGGWLSTTTWRPLDSKHQQGEDSNKLNKQGCFNMGLAPTAEELCSDDEDNVYNEDNNEDEGDDEEDEPLIRGQQLRNDSRRYWVYNEIKSVLENRRPAFYWSLFGWKGDQITRLFSDIGIDLVG
jgi:hypothetical protein